MASGDAFAEAAETLKIHYRALVDDELRYIATHSELTETARAVLERELMARGITDLDDYKRQLSEETPAEPRWSERFRERVFQKLDTPFAKLELLMTLLLGGFYIYPSARGEDRATPDKTPHLLVLMVLYCLLASAVQLVASVTMFAKYGMNFPLPYRLFSYFGPVLLLVGGVLLFKRSQAAIVLIALHIAWLAARIPVTAYVFEQYLSSGLFSARMFVAGLIVPALILAYGVLLWRKGFLR